MNNQERDSRLDQVTITCVSELLAKMMALYLAE